MKLPLVGPADWISSAAGEVVLTGPNYAPSKWIARWKSSFVVDGCSGQITDERFSLSNCQSEYSIEFSLIPIYLNCRGGMNGGALYLSGILNAILKEREFAGNFVNTMNHHSKAYHELVCEARQN